ncbi:hypothetical protein [Salmonella phage SSBI34]|nr:hypothetical protein [Salmonella phage SSBI34]
MIDKAFILQCIKNDKYIPSEPKEEINFREGERYICFCNGAHFDIYNPNDVDGMEPWSAKKLGDGYLGIFGFKNEVQFEII